MRPCRLRVDRGGETSNETSTNLRPRGRWSGSPRRVKSALGAWREPAPARYEFRPDNVAFHTLRIESDVQILFGRRAENTDPDVVVQVRPRAPAETPQSIAHCRWSMRRVSTDVGIPT